jgi:hypothetical protein
MDEKKEERRAHFTYDDKKDVVQVTLYMDKDVATNLGALVMAQDYVKNIYMQKGIKKKMQGMIVPGGNGDVHVL